MALSAGRAEAVAENLRELRNMTREALVDMRMLIFELHQPAWEEEGLASALQARIESVEARSGLQTEFHVFGTKRLPLAFEEELYRTVIESNHRPQSAARDAPAVGKTTNS
jgi:signal transduction histidine kinase